MLTAREKAERWLGATVRKKNATYHAMVVGHEKGDVVVALDTKPVGLITYATNPTLLMECDAPYLVRVHPNLLTKVYASAETKRVNRDTARVKYHLNAIVSYEHRDRLYYGLVVGFKSKDGEVLPVIRVDRHRPPKRGERVRDEDYTSPYGYNTEGGADERKHWDVAIDFKYLRVTKKKAEETLFEEILKW